MGHWKKGAEVRDTHDADKLWLSGTINLDNNLGNQCHVEILDRYLSESTSKSSRCITSEASTEILRKLWFIVQLVGKNCLSAMVTTAMTALAGINKKVYKAQS